MQRYRRPRRDRPGGVGVIPKSVVCPGVSVGPVAEPVCDEPVCEVSLCTEPVGTEPVCMEPVCTEPVGTASL